MRADTGTHQVKTVCVPAGADGDVWVAFTVGVTGSSQAEKINFIGSQVNTIEQMCTNKFASTCSMPWVIAIGFPLNVMGKGEVLDHLLIGTI